MKEHLELMPLLKEGYTKAVSSVYTKYHLTSAEFDIIMFLANNPEYTRAVDISEKRGIVKSQVSSSIHSLQAKGYLRKVQDERDLRTIHLYLEDSVEAIIQEGREAQYYFAEQLLIGFSLEEREKMRRNFKLLINNLQRFIGGNM